MTKVLLLGLGRWGVNHLRNLNAMPIELYVAEADAKRLEPARKLGLPEARLTANYRDFAAKVDCVVLISEFVEGRDLKDFMWALKYAP